MVGRIVKIFIIIDNLGAGGTQRQVIEYLKFANQDKFEIKIVNLDKDCDILANEIEKLGFEIIGINHKGFFSLRTILKLIRLFKQEKPKIVHTYLFTSDCYGRIAAKLAGVKVIISSARNIDLWQKWHHVLADRILARWTDKIIINAEAIRRYLVEKTKINPDKIVTISNGVDLRRFDKLRHSNEIKKELNIPQDAKVIGMVSRFSEQKDYDTFFKSAEIVLKQIPNVYFVAVGDGQLKRIYELRAKSYELKDRIVFTGLRRDIPDLINMMDVCVLSSHYEGCPNVILEYMACSKPVIAADVGGCSELVIDNKTGFIVRPNNPELMADRMLKLLKDAQMRVKMGKGGRERVEKYFKSEIMVTKTEEFYQQLLKNKIAFIFSQFPRYDETFILREMKQLKREGLNFIIYSIKNCKDKVIHDNAQELVNLTKYLPLFSFKLILNNLYFIVRHPIQYFATLIEVFFTNFKSPEFFLKSLGLWPQAVGFAWQARKDKITHVHGQWATYPATFAFIISKLNNISFSFTGHAHDIYVDTTGLKEKIEKAKFVLTCTEYNRRYLLGLMNGHPAQYAVRSTQYENKIIVSYHGVDLERFNGKIHGPRPLPVRQAGTVHRPFRIVSVGSLLPCKGFDILIEACRILRDEGIDFECTVAGGGFLEKSLKSQVSSHNLEEKIKFTGYITQDKLIPLYQQANVFVLPARLGIHWGIPNVLLEAMAAKVPVICTNLPSIPELIENNKTGFLIPEENPAFFAKALLKVQGDSKLREEIADAGYKAIEERFNLKKNTDKLTQLFNN